MMRPRRRARVPVAVHKEESVLFKNLMLYRVGAAWPASLGELEEALALEPFSPCSATQQKSVGWVPPRGTAHGALVESVAGQWIARLAIETRAVPADALRRKVDDMAAQIEASTGRTPGKRERRDMRDDALLALLPQAFPRRSEVAVWLDPATRLLAIDVSAQGKADEVVTSLLRVAGRGFGVAALQLQQSPQGAMAAWLRSEDDDALPAGFSIERECELKAGGDEPAVVRYARHTLRTQEVRQHIAEGKLPTRLALSWCGRVGFTLTEALQLKKIGFLEGVFDERGASADDDRFDADAALATGELKPLIADLIDALGGEAAPAQPAAGTAAGTSASAPPAAEGDAPF